MADLVSTTEVKSFQLNAEQYLTGADTNLGDVGNTIDQDIPIGATVEVVALGPATAAKIQSVWLSSDQNITLTVTLGTGSLTIALVAGVPWSWTRTYVASIPNPFLYNIVSTACANASGAIARLQGRLLLTA